MKKKIVRFLAALLSVVMLLSQSTPALAALTEGNSYSYSTRYLDIEYSTGNWQTANGNYHNNSGQVALRNLSNGDPLYCIQIYEGCDNSAATATDIRDTDLWNKELTDAAQNGITRVSIWGYNNYNYGYTSNEAQLATAILYWEFEIGARTNYSTSLTSFASNLKATSSSGQTLLSNALNCYKKILEACSNHQVRPSFSNSTITLKGTGESNAVTLTDTNGVLSQYTRTSTDKNITVNITGNQLKVWCTGGSNYSGSITLSKKNTYSDTAFALTGANQTLFYGTIEDPVSAPLTINVQSNKCNVSVAKQDSVSSAILDGATFKVQQWSYNQNKYVDYKNLSATEYNGSRRYTATDLEQTSDNGGWFRIVETGAPNGYELNPTFIPAGSYTSTAPGEFRLTDAMNGSTFNFTVKDPPWQSNASIVKQDSENSAVLDGAKFKLQEWSHQNQSYHDFKDFTYSNGKYTVSNLYFTTDNRGWFRFVETAAPNGYELNPTITADGEYNSTAPGEFQITEDMNGKTFSFQVKDAPEYGSLEVIKDAEDGIKAGHQFRLYGTSTIGRNVNITAVTDKNGIARFEKVYVGSYTLEEVETGIQYIVPPNQNAVIKWNEVTEKNFENNLKRGNFEVVKTSENGKVDGFKLHLFGISLSGIPVDEYAVTDKNGAAYFEDVLIGDDYTCEEVEVPDYYIQPKAQTGIKIEWNKTTTVSFYNELKHGDFKVTKTSENGKVDGFKIHFYGTSDSGAYVDEYAVTDKNGIATFKNILVGSNYTAEEVEVPDYYIQPEVQTDIKIEWNKTTSVSFYNELKRGDFKVTKTSENGKVDGFKIHFYGTSDSGAYVDEYAVTDKNGIATFKNILVGSNYTAEEVEVPDYYIQPKAQTGIKIEWNKTTNISFYNELKRSDLNVIKASEDGLNEGHRFHLFGTSLSGIPVDEYAVTDKNGVASFKNILIGYGYTVEEVDTDIRYVVPPKQSASIEWQKVTTVNFANNLKKFRVEFTKTDSEKVSPQSDATLAGAVYGIYKNSKLVDTYTTDADGKFTTKYYVCGDDWTIKEITPSTGYLLDKTVYKIDSEAELYTAEYNTISVTGTEQVIKGKAAIIKHSDNGETQIERPEVGAEFQIFLKSAGSYLRADEDERDILVCDEYGFAESKLLPYGVYTVHQIYGWDGRELMPDFDVFISENGQVYRYLINNSYFESYLKIVKTVADSKKPVLYAGAGFQLYDPNGNLITMQVTYPTPMVIDTFYTNSEGYLVTPQKLEYGKGYQLVEVQAPYGCILDSTPIEFDITEKTAFFENNLTVVTVERPNELQMGTIEINKSGAVFSTISQSGDIYTPIFENAALANTVFEIYAAENIVTPDGVLRLKKGQLADTVTTDENGRAVSKKLYLGKYIVKEKTASFSFVLNTDEYPVELTYQGQNVPLTSTSLSVFNERQKVSVSLEKVLEKDKLFNLGMNDEIKSIRFGLFSNEDITAADGTVIPQDSLITAAYCDENSLITFDCDLPIGFKWYVREMSADEHYIISDTKYEFETEYKGQDTEAYVIEINNGKPIENPLKRGSVIGYKVNRETGNPIRRALFGLFKDKETEFTEENALMTDRTNRKGIFTFEDLPKGQYLIKELKPAKGYLPNDEIYAVTINENEEIIEITVVNDLIPEIGTTATINGEKDVFSAEQFVIDDTVEYKHLIPGKEYTIKGVLMDKATGEPFVVNDEQVTSEATFIPEEPSGCVTVSFEFDASVITEKTDLVVFEELYKDDIQLAVHADLEDENQTVTVHTPEIGTTATVNNEKNVFAAEQFTIEDVVTYTDLIPNKEYTVKGVLMNKATGEPFVVNDEQVTSEATFTPEEPSGSVTVSFEFDASVITEKTDLVVFEELYKDDIQLVVHTDINDENQTVTIHTPEIGTTATIEDEKDAFSAETFTIEDVVTYSDLIPGKEYTIKGILMNKATGEPFVINDEQITSEAIFIPEEANGSAVVTFEFDASVITEKAELVAFEELYKEDIQLTVHADLEDKNQTVTIHVPEIRTTATANEEKSVFAAEEFTIEDVVAYSDLVPGREYKLVGILMNKATGTPLIINGETVNSEVLFTPEEADGTVTASFSFDRDCITENTDIVVFEELYYRDVEITGHKNIEDIGQTVTVLRPAISTVAAVNNEKDVFAAEKTIMLSDIVSYVDLIPGKEYTVKGVLMNKATGEPFVVNDEQVTSDATFIPEEPSGSVTVSFEFDASVITETTDLVAFEKLYKGETLIVSHEDINDSDQTITVHTPEIATTATIEGEKEAFATEIFTLEDVVAYTDLIPGKEYTVKGVLMNKATGDPFVVNDEQITSEATFTPEEPNGSVIVSFEFDSKYIKEETAVVAFETLHYNDIELAVHSDINDEGQTVTIKIPEIGTSATINGEKEITTTEIITVVDTVTYKNLTVGKEYVIKGILMDKKTGKPFLIDGKEIQVEASFVPEEPNGQIEIPFNFNGTSITNDTDIVVFETLYRDGVEIAVHTDLEDKDQTVTVHPQPEIPDTGDNNSTKIIITGTIISGVALLFFIYFYLRSKKREEKD